MTRDEAEVLAASRCELRDLAFLLALPAMWANQRPADIATGLLDVLFGVFRLESGYVCFDDPAGGPALERWRLVGARMPIELERALATTPTRAHGSLRAPVMTPSGEGAVRVTSMRPAFPDEDGLVLIGSRRSTFPTEFEMHQLRVIVDENDVLRDEGEAYAHRLTAAGVPTTSVRYNGIIHDFMMLNPVRGTQATNAAIAQAIDVLKTTLTTAKEVTA